MFKSHSFQVGNAVYYVLFDGPHYRIRKTRIAEITKTPSSRLYFDKYHYRCEDGYSFESVEALVPNFVFLTRKEAISFVIERLRSDLEYEKNYIVNVRQRLEQLRASLRVYTSASAGHENAPANMTYAKRLFGDLNSGADFNSLGCRDLGNGIRLSYICRSKEQAAYRITQFLRSDIARQEIILTTTEDELEQTRHSLKLYERYLESD